MRARVLQLVAMMAGALSGCTTFYPAQRAGARPQGPARVLAQLEESYRRGDAQAAERLFAHDCRVSCSGLVLFPTAVTERRVVGRWFTRLGQGSLLSDLEQLQSSYARRDTFRIIAVSTQVLGNEAAIRASLEVRGRDAAGRYLADHGLIDLTLRRTLAGWRITSLQPAWLERVLQLAPPSASRQSSVALPSGEEHTPRTPSSSDDETEEVEESPVEPTLPASGPALHPENMLALEMRGAGRRRPLSRWAGTRATLLLLQGGGGAGVEATCRALAEVVRDRPGVQAALLLLGEGAPSPARCALPLLSPTAASAKALGALRPLLPAVMILDAAGRTSKLVSGYPERVTLEAAVDAVLRQDSGS